MTLACGPSFPESLLRQEGGACGGWGAQGGRTRSWPPPCSLSPRPHYRTHPVLGANGSPQVPRLPLHCGAPTPLSSSCLRDLSPLASSSLGGHVCVSTLLAHSTGQVQRECPGSAGGAAALPTGQEEWSGDGATACRARVALAGPRLALVTNSHCCALCGCGAETQEKPALAPNRAPGNRVGSEFESRSLMPGLARASWDFSLNQASVMLEGPSSGRNRGGWPQRDGVQGSRGAAPTLPTMRRQGFRVLWQPRE